jgi:hypothetical protein
MSATLRSSRAAFTAMALAGALALGFAATSFAAGKPVTEPSSAGAIQEQQDWTPPAPANHTQPISSTMCGMGWG